VIEFINGQMVSHSGAGLPSRVLTNDSYSDSIGYFSTGQAPAPADSSSLARFCRAASMVEEHDTSNSGPMIDYSYRILDAV
jgi:hypothetical protein